VVVVRVGVGRTVQLKPGQKVVMSDNILTGPRPDERGVGFRDD